MNHAEARRHDVDERTSARRMSGRTCNACDTTYEVWYGLTPQDPGDACFEHATEAPRCPTCDADDFKKSLQNIGLLGLDGGKDIHIKQFNRSFSSTREVDKFMDEHGYRMTSEAETRAYRDDSREKADKVAQKMGFADKEAYQRHISDKSNVEQTVAAAREKKIKEYHDKYGNEGKQAADGSAWVDSPSGT